MLYLILHVVVWVFSLTLIHISKILKFHIWEWRDG